MRIDPVWFTLLSELFVNLSAGWFGAAFVVPAITEQPLSWDLSVLTIDVCLGMLFLVFAFQFRKAGKYHG